MDWLMRTGCFRVFARVLAFSGIMSKTATNLAFEILLSLSALARLVPIAPQPISAIVLSGMGETQHWETLLDTGSISSLVM